MGTIGPTEVVSLIFIIVFSAVTLYHLSHMKSKKRFYNEKDQ